MYRLPDIGVDPTILCEPFGDPLSPAYGEEVDTKHNAFRWEMTLYGKPTQTGTKYDLERLYMIFCNDRLVGEAIFDCEHKLMEVTKSRVIDTHAFPRDIFSPIYDNVHLECREDGVYYEDICLMTANPETCTYLEQGKYLILRSVHGIWSSYAVYKACKGGLCASTTVDICGHPYHKAWMVGKKLYVVTYRYPATIRQTVRSLVVPSNVDLRQGVIYSTIELKT